MSFSSIPVDIYTHFVAIVKNEDWAVEEIGLFRLLGKDASNFLLPLLFTRIVISDRAEEDQSNQGYAFRRVAGLLEISQANRSIPQCVRHISLYADGANFSWMASGRLVQFMIMVSGIGKLKRFAIGQRNGPPIKAAIALPIVRLAIPIIERLYLHHVHGLPPAMLLSAGNLKEIIMLGARPPPIPFSNRRAKVPAASLQCKLRYLYYNERNDQDSVSWADPNNSFIEYMDLRSLESITLGTVSPRDASLLAAGIRASAGTLRNIEWDVTDVCAAWTYEAVAGSSPPTFPHLRYVSFRYTVFNTNFSQYPPFEPGQVLATMIGRLKAPALRVLHLELPFYPNIDLRTALTTIQWRILDEALYTLDPRPEGLKVVLTLLFLRDMRLEIYNALTIVLYPEFTKSMFPLCTSVDKPFLFFD